MATYESLRRSIKKIQYSQFVETDYIFICPFVNIKISQKKVVVSK